jgi:hypothetical protein
MRILKLALIVGGIVTAVAGVLLIVFSTEMFFLVFNGPTGTLQEAAEKFHAHRTDVQRIVEIVRHDPALGWATPGLEPKDMTQQNGPLTARTVADYETISTILSRGEFRDLEIVRDSTSSRAPTFMRFVVFDPGRFGKPKPVLAEWAASGKSLIHSDGMPCLPAEDGWYLCPIDP